jgi:hypothetical protein
MSTLRNRLNALVCCAAATRSLPGILRLRRNSALSHHDRASKPRGAPSAFQKLHVVEPDVKGRVWSTRLQLQR